MDAIYLGFVLLLFAGSYALKQIGKGAIFDHRWASLGAGERWDGVILERRSPAGRTD